MTLNGCFPPGSPAMPFTADVTPDFIIPGMNKDNNDSAPAAPPLHFAFLMLTSDFFYDSF